MKNKIVSLIKNKYFWHLTAIFILLTVLSLSVITENKNTASADTPVVIRQLPATVWRGQTFDVTITFTATEKGFKLAGLTDHAPEGWTAQVDQSWCTPEANAVNAVGNIAEVNWRGNPSFDVGTTFMAIYKVTVPQDAIEGYYSFDDGDDASLLLIGDASFSSANVSGDRKVKVITGSYICGEICEVNGQPFPDDMPGITIDVSKNDKHLDTTTSNAQSQYSIHVTEADSYLITVSRTGFRDVSRSIDITTLDHDYTLNFKGNFGLIPNACDIWYVLDCAALWKYTPADPELGLDIWRLLDVAAAWKYPVQ